MKIRKKLSRTPVITAIAALIIAGGALYFLFWFSSILHRLDTQTLNTDPGLIVSDGDFVNIDFVGTVDGEALRGGNTNGEGEDLLIGSGAYIDDFEDQLIGHHVGETVEVVVTFPEDYADDELRNKEVVYVTTINGIYE